MNVAKIEILIGAMIPMRHDPNEAFNLLQDLVSDLCKKEIEFPIDANPKGFLKVKRLKNLRGQKNNLWKSHKNHIREEVILNFSSTIKFPDQDFSEYISDVKGSNAFYLNHILIPDFEKRFYDFIVSLNIARVGALYIGTGLILVNGVFIKTLKSLGFYPIEILAHSLEKKWPVFEPLDIFKTWNWYLTKAYEGKVDEISSSNLSRAINAFTFLFNRNLGETGELFWCMVGIEALYVKGKENIIEQVRKKSEAFLGEIKEFKKRHTKMYSYRSSFVHGAKNFFSYFHIHDALITYDEYINESSEVLYVAESLLLATLQKMAKMNLTDLEFDYILKK